LERGSRGPSTVTLIALEYVATCVGEPATEIVNVKLFPVIVEKIKYFNILRGWMFNFHAKFIQIFIASLPRPDRPTNLKSLNLAT